MMKLLLIIPLMFVLVSCGSQHTYTLDYDDQGDAEDMMMDQYEQEIDEMSKAQDDYYNRDDDPYGDE